jgi:hypothetical protein
MATDAEIERSTLELCRLTRNSPEARKHFNSMQVMRYYGTLDQTASAIAQRNEVLKQNAAHWSGIAQNPRLCFGAPRKVGDGVGTPSQTDIARVTGVYVERAGLSDQVWIGENYAGDKATVSSHQYIPHTNDWQTVARALGIAIFKIPPEGVIQATASVSVAGADQCGLSTPHCVRVGEKAQLRVEARDTLWAKATDLKVEWTARCSDRRPTIAPRPTKPTQHRGTQTFTADLEFRRESSCTVFARLTLARARDGDDLSVVVRKPISVDGQVASVLLQQTRANDRLYASYRQRRWFPFVTPHLTAEQVKQSFISDLEIVSGEAVRDFARTIEHALKAAAAVGSDPLAKRTGELLAKELAAWGDLLGYRALRDGSVNLPWGRKPVASNLVELTKLRTVNFCGYLHKRIETQLVKEGLLEEKSPFSPDHNELSFDTACKENATPLAFLLRQQAELAAELGEAKKALRALAAGRPAEIPEPKPLAIHRPKRLVLRRADTRGAARYRVMRDLERTSVAEVPIDELDVAKEYPPDAMTVEPVILQGVDEQGRLSQSVHATVDIAPREASVAFRVGYSWGTQATIRGVVRPRAGPDFGLTLRAFDESVELQTDFIWNDVRGVEASVHGEHARLSTGILLNFDCFMPTKAGLCPPWALGLGGGYEFLNGAPYARARFGARLRTSSIVQFVPHFAATLYLRPVYAYSIFGRSTTIAVSHQFMFGTDLLAF